MSDEKENAEQWHVFGASVTGASHIRKKMPNQDAIRWKTEDGFPFALALADGHGSEKYFRSGVGAHFATEIAIAELAEFAQNFNEPIMNMTLFERLYRQLPERIVARWRKKVAEDLQADHFFNAEEWQRFGNGTDLPPLPSDPLLSYGATLLAVLVTPFFILYIQLGDGDIVLIDKAAQVSRPMPEDTRLLANETTSLCSPMAVQDFRIRCDYLDGPSPTLILLSSDGYVNSFSSEEGFLRVGSDILHILRTDGLAEVKNSLSEWLTVATEKGSGDDISLGVLYHEVPAHILNNGVAVPEKADNEVTGELEPQPVQEALLTSENAQETSTDDTSALEGEASTPRVLTVSLQPEAGAYTSIGEALKQAIDHMRIEISPGTYHEQLNIDRDVELVGLGDPGLIIIEGPVPCVRIQAEHAALQNLVIRGQDRQLKILPNPLATVEITSGGSLISHCQISGSKIGIRVSGATTAPVFQTCEIYDTTGTGLIFTSGAQGSVLESHIYANKQWNVEITEGSHPLMRGCIIEACKQSGIRISKNSAGTIEGCTIASNASTGIEIRDDAAPTFRDCSIASNQGFGILFTGEGKGIITGCQFTQNKLSGITISGNAQPTIQHCHLYKSDGSGILINGKGAGGVIEHCEITDNTTAGILLQQSSQPIIRHCQIQSSDGVGVLVKQKGQGSIEHCKISSGDRSQGILLEEKDRRLLLHHTDIQ